MKWPFRLKASEREKDRVCLGMDKYTVKEIIQCDQIVRKPFNIWLFKQLKFAHWHKNLPKSVQNLAKYKIKASHIVAKIL